MKRTRLILSAVIVLLAGLFLLLSWQNSLALVSVSFRVNEGVKEPMDHTILNLGGKHLLPDYKVKLRITRKLLTRDLGTKINTSATNWLEFPVSDLVPLRRVQEVIVVNENKTKNELLERVQVSGSEFKGEIYEYRLGTTRSFEVGLNWFFDTALGKAIAAGVTIGIILLIISKAR